MAFDGTDYWRGLLDWMSDSLLSTGRISPKDLDLITLTDDLDKVVQVIAASE